MDRWRRPNCKTKNNQQETIDINALGYPYSNTYISYIRTHMYMPTNINNYTYDVINYYVDMKPNMLYSIPHVHNCTYDMDTLIEHYKIYIDILLKTSMIESYT